MTKAQDETARAFPYTDDTGARMVNAHSLCREYVAATGKPMPAYISYRAQQTGRAYQSAAWQVIRPGFKTDPKAHWRDYGHKTFDVFGRELQQEKFEEAKAWASERYGVTEWAKTNRLRTRGDWFPAEVVAWLDAAVKVALKNS